MKTILFCNLPYAFSILEPLAQELEKRHHEYLWYIPQSLSELFPYSSMPYTSHMKDIEAFGSDAIFVPGNEVPYWLRGVKVQIFHGLAGEKKGHFRIRDYFDLYLTQGPYFTERFQALAKKHKNFSVTETGWCKLDSLYDITKESKEKRERLLREYGVKYILLYAPTFSPSLTSAAVLKETIARLSSRHDILCLIKFHDKMDRDTIEAYRALEHSHILIVEESNITESMQIADLMLSDTSSVVYEFTLLDKPVITLNSHSENITWSNHTDPKKIYPDTVRTLGGNDKYRKERSRTIAQYHPYNDGRSAKRVIDTTEAYIQEHGVPDKRKLPLLRKLKIKKKFK